MDSSEQLKQLLDLDLSSLSAYYREMAAFQGAGVLVVNYYPSGEAAQMSANFLKPSQIGRLARQMGLPTLQLEFEQHNQHNQMVVALISPETKGVVTVELPELEVQTEAANTLDTHEQTSTASSTKRKEAPKTTTKSKSSAKSTPLQQDGKNQPQTLEPVPQVASKPTAEAETTTQVPVVSETTVLSNAESETIPQPPVEVVETTSKLAPESDTTPKAAAKRKLSSKTPTKRKSSAKSTLKNSQVQAEPENQASPELTAQPEATTQPTVESETTPQASPEAEITPKPAAKGKSDSKTSTTGKSASKTTTRRKSAYSPRARRKKESQQ